MHLHIRHLLICLLLVPILFIYIALPLSAHAQTTPQQFLNVSPIIQDLHLVPGQPATYSLTITNKGDKPVGFHIDVTGIDPTADSIQDYSHLTSPFLSWIQVNPTDLIVAPHDKNSFTITVNTPKNAKESGYYATVFLTPFISNPLQPTGPVILERIGTLLLATVGNTNYTDLKHKVSIHNFGFVQDGLFSPHAITFQVTNAYFTHFTAKPFLTFVSILDKETTVMPIEKHILPGSTRTWEFPIKRPWYTLYSSAQLAVSIGNGQQILAQTTFINYPLLFGAALILCLLLLVLKRSKQLKKALKILFAGHD